MGLKLQLVLLDVTGSEDFGGLNEKAGQSKLLATWSAAGDCCHYLKPLAGLTKQIRLDWVQAGRREPLSGERTQSFVD